MTDYYEELYQMVIDKLQSFDHIDDAARYFLYLAHTIDKDIFDNFENSLEKFAESVR